MREYTSTDEEDLIRQIQSDTELDKELEQAELVKGHVVEIRYVGAKARKAKGLLSRLFDRMKAVIHPA